MQDSAANVALKTVNKLFRKYKKSMNHTIFFEKAFRRLQVYSFILLDAVCFPFTILSLISFMFLLVKKKKRKMKNAIFVGLEHVINKSAIRGEQLRKFGFKPVFYTHDASGHRSVDYLFELIRIPNQRSDAGL